VLEERVPRDALAELGGVFSPRRAGRGLEAGARSRSVPNLQTVLDESSSRGRSTVVGNSGLLGESGKCCASSASPARAR
jgi:hypothetical protein